LLNFLISTCRTYPHTQRWSLQGAEGVVARSMTNHFLYFMDFHKRNFVHRKERVVQEASTTDTSILSRICVQHVFVSDTL